MRSSRWSTVHRKQLYQQRSPARSAPHAPSPPPSRAPLPSSRRPRTTRHPPASATTTPTISDKVTQRARSSRPCFESRKIWPMTPVDRNSSNTSRKRRRSRDTNSSTQTRRRRRRHQNGPRRRRRRRRERRPRHSLAADWSRCGTANRRTPSITASAPFPLPRRRRLSQRSGQPQRSRSPIYHQRASPRKSASWSAAVAGTAGSPLFSIAPLEGRGSRGR